MRICFICPGNFTHIAPYLQHFHGAGHDVHFLALSPSPPRPVTTHQLGLGYGGKWQYLPAMARARGLVRRLRPDIVHAHFATSGGLAGLVCGFQPTIVTAHGTDVAIGLRSAKWRVLLKAVFAQAACVNPVSEELKSLVLLLGVESRKVEVINPGVDTKLFSPGPPRVAQRGEPLRLVCTRRLEPVYDAETIVEALATLKARGVAFRMTFAGGGSRRPALEELARRRGLQPEVSFLAGVSHDRMPAVLREHDVYLSASQRDGTSLSLLEAMATGLFPVVSDIPANAAWLQDGEGGFLHRAGDPGDLAARLLEFVSRPGLAERAAAVNAQAVARRGCRGANMRRLERLYLEILREAR